MSSPRAALLLRLALPALALAAPLQARPLAVTTERPFTTWRDALVLVVRGASLTPCGAAAVGLHLVRTADQGIDLELREPCALGSSPASEEPFALRVPVGELLDGPWAVRVWDAVDGDLGVHELTIYEVGQLDLDLPPVILAGSPVPLRVRGFAQCAVAHARAVATVSPGLVEVAADSTCLPITNPPGGYFQRDLELPPLVPGDYLLRAHTRGGWGSEAVQESTFRVWDPELCVPSATRLCLQSGRFRVTATWRDFDGNEGVAGSAPLAGNDTAGLLWFFSPDNAELTVKVLDACGLNGHWWVFLSSSSNVRYEVVVTDTRTGDERRYDNGLGNLPRLVADTAALAGCASGG